MALGGIGGLADLQGNGLDAFGQSARDNINSVLGSITTSTTTPIDTRALTNAFLIKRTCIANQRPNTKKKSIAVELRKEIDEWLLVLTE